MLVIRHSDCNARLYDSKWPCQEIPQDAVADIRVRCWRCRRKHKDRSVVALRLKLPKLSAPVEPKAILCANPNCLTRIADIAQPATYHDDEHDADLSLFCQKCKTRTYLRLTGLVRVV